MTPVLVTAQPTSSKTGGNKIRIKHENNPDEKKETKAEGEYVEHHRSCLFSWFTTMERVKWSYDPVKGQVKKNHALREINDTKTI